MNKTHLSLSQQEPTEKSKTEVAVKSKNKQTKKRSKSCYRKRQGSYF